MDAVCQICCKNFVVRDATVGERKYECYNDFTIRYEWPNMNGLLLSYYLNTELLLLTTMNSPTHLRHR
jgi:hypothetical protein